MKRHHEGAVTMSTDYLEDPRGTNPILRKLAHAIIANQRFEIALLDDVRRRVEKEPETVADLGFMRIMRREIGSMAWSTSGSSSSRGRRDSWTWRSRRASRPRSET